MKLTLWRSWSSAAGSRADRRPDAAGWSFGQRRTRNTGRSWRPGLMWEKSREHLLLASTASNGDVQLSITYVDTVSTFTCSRWGPLTTQLNLNVTPLGGRAHHTKLPSRNTLVNRTFMSGNSHLNGQKNVPQTHNITNNPRCHPPMCVLKDEDEC